jgi:hypothetical protein
LKTWQYIVIGLVIWAIWWSVDATQGQTASSASTTGLGSGFVQAWAQAIAGFENVASKYNNPGGLNGGNFAGMVGTTPAAGGTGHDVIDEFDSLSDGFAALQTTLNNFIAKYGGDSLLDATANYVLGPSGAAAYNGNYPASVVNEANYVANQLGVPVTSTLDDLEGSDDGQ